VTEDRNRTTVRRALRAGGVAAAITGISALGAALGGKVPGGFVVAAALAAGSLVAAFWLLLAGLLDVFAGEPPNARRVLWMIGIVVLAMLGPFLMLGVFAQAARGGV
jgi:hypothetical protein